jgi:hypothetical protein
MLTKITFRRKEDDHTFTRELEFANGHQLCMFLDKYVKTCSIENIVSPNIPVRLARKNWIITPY